MNQESEHRDLKISIKVDVSDHNFSYNNYSLYHENEMFTPMVMLFLLHHCFQLMKTYVLELSKNEPYYIYNILVCQI